MIKPICYCVNEYLFDLDSFQEDILKEVMSEYEGFEQIREKNIKVSEINSYIFRKLKSCLNPEFIDMFDR